VPVAGEVRRRVEVCGADDRQRRSRRPPAGPGAASCAGSRVGEASDAQRDRFLAAENEARRVAASDAGTSLRNDGTNFSHPLTELAGLLLAHVAATSVGTTQDLVARLEAEPTGPWVRLVNHSYIEVYRARNLTFLGEYGTPVDSFQRVISSLPRGYRWDCGVYLAREAVARATKVTTAYLHPAHSRSVNSSGCHGLARARSLCRRLPRL
jgi:hypothetical protein